MRQTIVVFGALIISLLLLFKISKYALFLGETPIEAVLVSIAIIFFAIGYVLHKKSLQKKPNPGSGINKSNLQKTGLTKREFEVLGLIAKGFSNKEIAARLFVTESTVKTHVSNILVKLDAKRRTDALKKAKKLEIIEF